MRAGGVAIYQKDTAFNVAVPHTIQKISEEYDAMLGVADQVGDICAASIMVMDIEVLLITVYISPGTTVQDTKMFMTRNLFNYVKQDTPIVVTGDFNIDVSKQENIKFVDFMIKHFNLKLANRLNEATTLGGSCIDLTFIKNISVECSRYCSYFSYHRPIITIKATELSNI